MMPAIAPSPRLRERKRILRSYPARTLHLIDIENLAGSATPSLAQVQTQRARDRTRLRPGSPGHVHLAGNRDLGVVEPLRPDPREVRVAEDHAPAGRGGG